MGNREFRVQLKDKFTKTNIITAGGTVFVAQAGLTKKQTLYDKDGAALANPLTPTRGFINFFAIDTAATVDLYIMAPGGQFVVMTGVVPSGPNEIEVDVSKKEQLAKIPFSVTDQGGDATETDTGFDLPNPCLVLDRLHGSGLYVTAIDATETIDVGTGQVHPAETGGDANGLNAAAVLDNLGLLVGTNGALHSSNAPYASDAQIAKSITYTLTTGADTANGFILLAYRLI